MQDCEIDDSGDLVTDRVPAAVRDGSQSFNKLGDRQRDCRPLSELGRAVRSPVAPEPPSGETDYQTEDHMEDRVPSSDIHTERRSESGSKDKTQDHPSEQDQGLPPWRSWLDSAVRHCRIMSPPDTGQMAACDPALRGSERSPGGRGYGHAPLPSGQQRQLQLTPTVHEMT